MYMGSGGVLLHGIVAAFDAGAGTGTVVTDAGAGYPFHCIEIADGSRSISVGTAVEFAPLAKFGSYQAAQIRPV